MLIGLVTFRTGIPSKTCYWKKTEGTGRRRRISKQLIDYIKETRKCWNLKEEALNLTLWTIHFERDYAVFCKADYVMMMMTQ
jgi:hypothetical protein